MTPAAQQGLAALRETSNFQWTLIPILILVIYVYSVEMGKENWKVVLAGLAFIGMDFFNELWNGLVFHFTGYAPVWGAPADSSFIILIGWNIEILFMFMVLGVAAVKSLPADKNKKILGVPNRSFYIIFFTTACVAVECVLNAIGALTWDWAWWSIKFPLFIFLIGYLPFFVVSFWVHDMETDRQRVKVVSSILAFDFTCAAVFGGLGWI